LRVASALVLVTSVVNLARVVEGSADERDAAPADPDLVGRCGADVLLVADATLPADETAGAARALTGALQGTGSRLAVVVADDLARPLGDGFVDVTPDSLSDGGAAD